MQISVTKSAVPDDRGDNYWFYEDEQGKHYEEGTLST